MIYKFAHISFRCVKAISVSSAIFVERAASNDFVLGFVERVVKASAVLVAGRCDADHGSRTHDCSCACNHDRIRASHSDHRDEVNDFCSSAR